MAQPNFVPSDRSLRRCHRRLRGAVGNLVDSVEAANPDIAMQEVHTPEEEDEEEEAPASDPLFGAIESAQDDSRAWMNDGLF